MKRIATGPWPAVPVRMNWFDSSSDQKNVDLRLLNKRMKGKKKKKESELDQLRRPAFVM